MHDKNHLAARLRNASLGRAQAPFLVFRDGGTLGYGGFFAKSERMAAAMVAHGVTPGDWLGVEAPRPRRCWNSTSAACLPTRPPCR